MSSSRDIAKEMVNRSIDLALMNNDNRYLMDFVKVHKLLYLGYCHLLSEYNMELFEDDIYNTASGPYINGIGFITAQYGFGLLDNKIPDKDADGFIYFTPSFSRGETIDFILDRFGRLDTDEVVKVSKGIQKQIGFEYNYEDLQEYR